MKNSENTNDFVKEFEEEYGKWALEKEYLRKDENRGGYCYELPILRTFLSFFLISFSLFRNLDLYKLLKQY